MGPSFSPKNICDRRKMNPILLSQRLLGHPTIYPYSSDNLNVNIRKYCILVILAFSFIEFSLGCCVLQVIGHGSEEKMIRSNTRFDIATMQNVQTWWDFTVAQNPRHPMCWLTFISKPKTAVTATGSAASPKPATIWVRFGSFINLSPKAFFRRISSASLSRSFLKFWTEFCGNIKLFLHNQSSFVCATFPVSPEAREHFAMLPNSKGEIKCP